ncbi:MAG: TonB-dependent receptor, partial [Rhizorhabdus sp.]|nr:TonB-dependent receptor [Rhizorhabdus sp.]
TDVFVDEAACAVSLGNLPYTRAKDNEPTYTLGFDWKITDRVMVYGVHHRGFRAATVNSPLFTSNFTTGGLGCQSPPAPAGGRCPDLRPFQTTEPEKVTDVEIGVKTNWTLGDVRGRFNVAAYQLKLKGLVQFLQSAELGIPSSAPDRPQSGSLGINLADQTVKGIEVDAAISPIRGLTFTGNASYVDHKIDRVNFPAIGNFSFTAASINRPTPKFSGTASIEYVTEIDASGTQLAFNGELYHSTSYRPQSGIALPGYDTANGRIDLRNIAGKGFDFGFWMKNITNEKYIDAPIVLSPAFPVATGLYGERRTFGVDLRVRFGA